MPSTYINYTTTTDLNTIEEFEDFINDRWVQHDLLMLLTHKHENDIAQLDEGTDVAIDIVHIQHETFKAVPEYASRPDHFNHVSCEFFIEYSVINVDE
tara:strand:+ start:814 stop:1107 length:294 start_codon:yes stop_codon:yes gene_type:complete